MCSLCALMRRYVLYPAVDVIWSGHSIVVTAGSPAGGDWGQCLAGPKYRSKSCYVETDNENLRHAKMFK